MVLRAQSDGQFKVIGECYLHGLCDGTALVGQLAKPWIVQALAGRHGIFNDYCFLNTETREVTRKDPRLGPLPEGWERHEVERTSDDPGYFECFKHKTSGEVMNSDPRLKPEALKVQGVDLREYVLV